VGVGVRKREACACLSALLSCFVLAAKNDSAIVANMDTVYLVDDCIQQDIGLAV